MEKALCKYHHAAPIWYCEDCDSHFCPQCMPGAAANYPRNKPRCVLCQGFVTFEGGAHSATPFWQRASDFFRYPLKKNAATALWTIIGLLAVASVMPLGGLLYLLLSVGIFRYGLLIVQGCINGDFNPPPSSALFEGDEEHLFLKFIAIMFAYGGLIALLATVSPTLAQVAAFFMPLLIPANIILLAATSSLLTALNPLKVLWLVLTIGAPYALMGLLVMGLSNAPYYFVTFFHELIPGWLMLAFTGGVTSYFGFVTCAMMGYTVYQYQRELGYSSSNDDEYYLDPAVFEKQKTRATIHIFIQEGRYKEARELLLNALREDEQNLEMNDLLHRLLLSTGNLVDLQQHSCHCAEFLVKKGYTGKAASYYLDTLIKVPGFQLDRADVSCKVAEQLFQQGKPREAALLLKNLHQRFPDYGLLFNAYFQLAQIFAEGLQDDVTALKLLDFLAARFQKNTRLPELEAYRQRLQAGKEQPA